MRLGKTVVKLIAAAFASTALPSSADESLQALHDACRLGDWEAFQEVMKNFTGDIDGVESYDHPRTALSWAVLAPAPRNADKVKIVKALLEAGANPGAKASNPYEAKFSPMASALRAEFCREVIDLLIEYGAPLDSGPTSPLGYAASLQDREAVEYLLAKEASVGEHELEAAMGSRGAWPDDDAVAQRELAFGIVERLLEAGSTRGRWDLGFETVKVAVRSNDPKVISLIASHVGDMTGTDPEGRTVIHALVNGTGRCNADALNMLHKNFNIPLDAQDVDGNTALHLAVDSKNSEAVIRLLTAGANPFLKNHKGHIPAEIPGWGNLTKEAQTTLKTYSAEDRKEEPPDEPEEVPDPLIQVL